MFLLPLSSLMTCFGASIIVFGKFNDIKAVLGIFYKGRYGYEAAIIHNRREKTQPLLFGLRLAE